MENRKYDYSKQEIVKALLDLGVKEGDSLFMHANIGFFGRLESAETKEDYYDIFKDAIFSVIKSSGTLIVPTFTYSFCKKKEFDVLHTPGTCGMFSESLREDTEALRSEDANFSVAAIGKYAEHFTRDAPQYSFGKDSFWDRFRKAGGKICNFNFDSGSTYIHYVESELSVPYRYYKVFNGESIIDGKKEKRRFYHFVYDLEKPGNCADFSKFDGVAKNKGVTKTVNLGKGQIILITAEDTFNLIKTEIETNPALLIRSSSVE